MEIDRNGLEVLDKGECLKLLATATLGRVGTTSGALPVVLPVNFRLVNDRVVFRTGEGTKLEAATCNAVIAFEADEIEAFFHSGWSVLVTGVAREVTDPRELAELEEAHIARWAPTGNGRVVALSTEIVSGRRLTPGLPQPPTR
jgi:nitroimidazol reductase NimA-like FMN-containing flavoprotein (pyridoxamine 5'-phosphate oxidase superfamily)